MCHTRDAAIFKELVLVSYGCSNKAPQSSDLKLCEVIILDNGTAEVCCGPHRPNTKVAAGLSSFWRLLGRLCFLTLPSFENLLPSLALSPIHHPSQGWGSGLSSHHPHSASLITSASLMSLPLPLFPSTFVGALAHLGIQQNLLKIS